MRARLLLGVGWLLANLAWLQHDLLLRDGDEEGHVGAAELLMDLLGREGLLPFLHAALMGDLGEYPPLYPALVALWWRVLGGGLPGRPAVRALSLLWPLLAASAVGRIARPERRTLAFALVLCAPGLCGLGRHFMPEGALVAAVALVALAAARARAQPDTLRAVLLGVALGGTLLIKQTAVLYVLGPLLWALPALRLRSLGSLGVAALIAGPWYLGHLGAQSDYLARSVAVGEGSLLAGLLYYPVVMGWSEAGPLLSLLLILALADRTAWRRPSGGMGMGLLWLGVGLLALTVIPRKYPRLLAPLLPAAALVAAGVQRERWGWAAAAGSTAWVVAASTVWLVPEPPGLAGVDEGCLQRWLRPPVETDFGLAAVATAARTQGATVVVVVDGPAVPCAVQTTHPWADHLGPYLRRAGVEAEVVPDLAAVPRGARVLTVRWHPGGLTAGFDLGEGVVE